jgi:hypothetical protein
VHEVHADIPYHVEQRYFGEWAMPVHTTCPPWVLLVVPFQVRCLGLGRRRNDAGVCTCPWCMPVLGLAPYTRSAVRVPLAEEASGAAVVVSPHGVRPGEISLAPVAVVGTRVRHASGLAKSRIVADPACGRGGKHYFFYGRNRALYSYNRLYTVVTVQCTVATVNQTVATVMDNVRTSTRVQPGG